MLLRKAHAPPGAALLSPSGTPEKKAPEKEEPPAEEAAAAAEPAPKVDEGPPLESLKLLAIGAIATAKDAPSVRDALKTLVQNLQAAGPAVAPGAARGLAGATAAGGGGGESYDSSVAALKAALKLRGTHGIISIGKKFRSMDDSGDHKLTYDEFKKAMVEMKLGLAETDMMRLFRHFDSDASGYLTFDELLVGLRGQLNERRLGMVQRCFKVLDKTGDGKVTLADLEHRYDASRHPDVIAGTKSARMVLLEFLGTFENAGGGTKGDGQVEFEEFKAYYSMISANIDDGPSGDDYFELMMRNVWHVSGGEGWCANTTCKRVLVVFTDDSQKVVEITDDFDVDTKDLAAVKAKLVEQGVKDIKSVALYGDMSSTESGSGPAAATPQPTTPRSPGGAAGMPSSSVKGDPISRPSTGRSRNPEALRSSIIFG